MHFCQIECNRYLRALGSEGFSRCANNHKFHVAFSQQISVLAIDEVANNTQTDPTCQEESYSELHTKGSDL